MNKTIVFDLDDTISFCHDRNWENAKPNIMLIRKINQLFNDGFRIVIHSSRGQLSGHDYTKQVRYWLEDNGVLYSELQFGKPLGMLYVDDKAVKPDYFVTMQIEKIESGLSGKTVIRLGDSVYKDDINIHQTVAWYEIAKNYFHVPEVKSVVGNQLVLEYIPEKRKATIEELEIFLKIFKELQPINNKKWIDYIKRIEEHTEYINANFDVNLYGIIQKLVDMEPPPKTFSHGDFNPDNTIVSGKRKELIYLIDPINVTYSSYKLDEAKLLAWRLRTESDLYPTTLSIAETIRTLKYIKDKELLSKLINICQNFLTT